MNDVTLREITKKDWDFILDLRNEFHQNFYKQKKSLTKEEHYSYLEKQETNQNFHHWIIKFQGEDAGYVRVLDEDVGIMIKKNYHSKGIATHALKLVESEAKRLGIKKLIALIRIENNSSKTIFTKNDFKLVMEWYEKELK